MRKLKNCIKHLKEETESWYFNNRHLYNRNNIDKKIRYIIKNFIGDNYEIDSQQTTNLVLNIYEKA